MTFTDEGVTAMFYMYVDQIYRSDSRLIRCARRSLFSVPLSILYRR